MGLGQGTRPKILQAIQWWKLWWWWWWFSQHKVIISIKSITGCSLIRKSSGFDAKYNIESMDRTTRKWPKKWVCHGEGLLSYLSSANQQIASWNFVACVSASGSLRCKRMFAHSTFRREEKPTRCHWMLYCTYDMFNMFRALLCPSSGARDYVCYYRLWCAVLGCWLSGSGAGQQAMRPGRGMLHNSVVQHPSSWTHSLLPCTWPRQPTTKHCTP